MSRVCELTGKRAMVGNNVSHAMNKTDQWLTLKVCTSVLKDINKKGIYAVVKEAREKGFLNK